MKKISIPKLVEFRRKSDRAKKTFVQNIKSNKIESPADGGGDYWVTGLSAVCNSFKCGELGLIDEKIDELLDKIASTEYERTKDMYKRNIQILQKYKSFDVKKLRPSHKLQLLKKSTANRILTVKGLELEAKPSHIYVSGKEGEKKVGAIWFVAKVNGYSLEEVGMFCEMLYRFLKYNYSSKYQLLPEYCIAIDMIGGQAVSYSEIQAGHTPQVLAITLDEINKLM